MKCYNHIELDAVATCQLCGKALCRACAAKYSPCMCDECADAVRREAEYLSQAEEIELKARYRDTLIDTRGEFVRACLKGLLIAFLVFGFYHVQIGDSFGESLAFATFCFFAPFGWRFLTYLQSYSNIFLIGNIAFWFVWIGTKALLGLILGIPCFIFQAIKTIRASSELNKLT